MRLCWKLHTAAEQPAREVTLGYRLGAQGTDATERHAAGGRQTEQTLSSGMGLRLRQGVPLAGFLFLN